MREPLKTDTNWLEARKTFLGSSEWAVVAGLFTKYKSPLDVYNDKINGHEEVDNIRMRLGRDIEPMIAKWFEEETGLTVATDGYTRFHVMYDFIGTTLDGVVVDNDGVESILEIKTASQIARDTWGAELPIQYYTQIQGQMLVTGMRKAYVAILTFGYAGPDKFEIQEYEYDQEFTRMIIPKLVSFWEDHVLKQIPPEATTEQDLKTLYPVSNDHVVEADMELASKIDVLKKRKQELKQISEAAKDLEIDIKKSIGDAHSVVYGDETLATWKSGSPRQSFDYHVFKVDHPDLFEKYQKQSGPIRTFRIK